MAKSVPGTEQRVRREVAGFTIDAGLGPEMALGVREHGLAPCARSGTWQPGGIACGTKMVDAAM